MWGTGIFSNDTAADLKDDYRDLIAEGLTPDQATSKLVEDYRVGSDPESDNDFWLALAITGHKLGQLAPNALAKALGVLDDPAELTRWPAASRRARMAALTKARETLTSPLPEPKRPRVRKKVDTALAPGQHIEWNPGNGKPEVLFRVLGIHEDKGGRSAVLLALKWDGSDRGRKRANRLDGLPGGYDGLRRREVALGFIAIGTPNDPPDLRVLDSSVDRRTPTVGFDRHQYVTPWSELHRFFTASGSAAIPPEAARGETTA